ncbi:hypothetical protein WA026_000995 [Henosepilachna vigintioctopunctata]|uniref:Uncharacterized protein n=1 Tax=Henosepilachna vigintioctopunctata TaxID=420089 RepID=A0AAW1V900_9CUCU
MELYMSVSESALACISFPLTCFIGMIFMPESPYYLLMRNRTTEARISLEKLRGTDDVDQELQRMSTAVKVQKEESKGKFKDVFMVPSNRKALLIMMLLRAAQQLSGITALIFYISLIFEQSGAYFSVGVSTIIFFAAQLVMSILGSAAVDWTGRRILLYGRLLVQQFHCWSKEFICN